MPGSKFKLLPGIIVPNRKNAICQFWSNRAKLYRGAHAVGGYYSTNGSAMMRCSIKMRLGRYMLMGILVPFKFAGTEMVA